MHTTYINVHLCTSINIDGFKIITETAFSRMICVLYIDRDTHSVLMADTKELREMIADIDQQIIELIATRMEIADELAKAKKKSSQSYWDEDKEREVIARYHELCEEVSLTPQEAEQIAKVILKISKDRQHHFFE